MQNRESNTPTRKKHVATSKEFDAEYIFGGTWKGKILVGASVIKCKFALRDIKKYGVKNVIKFYAIKYELEGQKYNCFIHDFGKKKSKNNKEELKNG